MNPTARLLAHIATEPKGREWLTTLRSLAAEVQQAPKVQDLRFEQLWKDYDRYGSKAKALAYWHKLPTEDRDAIMDKAPEYIASTPGCAYRKQLEGWINPLHRLWERPIPKTIPINYGQPATEDEYTRKRRLVAEANAVHYRDRDAFTSNVP